MILSVCITTATQSQVPDLNYNFEGILSYTYLLLDSNENKLPFPIEEDEEYRNETRIINRVVKGESLRMIGNQDIYLDSEMNVAYQIDHDRKSITKILKTKVDQINPIEFVKLGETKIQNHLCDIYFIKYVHEMSYMKSISDFSHPDTVSCTFYIARYLKAPNQKKFAELQGNNNSKIIDGRFSGVTLKVIMSFSDGQKIVIDIKSIELREISDLVKLPPYAFK